MKTFIYLICIFLGTVTTSCQDQTEKDNIKTLNQKAEYIYRAHDEYLFIPPRPIPQTVPLYPWESRLVGNHPKITKEFFRCKGSNLNPVHIVQGKTDVERFFDCSGAEKHSLPLRDGKEFIYPILIDLMNYIQSKTGKRVVITSGHRCPDHNVYCDASPSNQASKHMIGAEVSFYVQGLEEKPEIVINHLQDYYTTNPKYKDQNDFIEFKRYEKDDTNVATKPWYNKEIFIKLFQKKEGRNFDNRHPYPYISIQVRFDIDSGKKVIYTWKEANQNFLRK